MNAKSLAAIIISSSTILLIFFIHLFSVTLPSEQVRNKAFLEQDKNLLEYSRLICPPSYDGKAISPKECETFGKFERDREYRISDHKAQVSMKNATWITAVLTAIGLILIGVTLYQAWKAATVASGMLNEAKKATIAANETVKLTREMGQTQVRSWITSLDPKKELHTAGPYYGAVTMRFQNTGNSPALNVKLYSSLFASADPSIPIFEHNPETWKEIKTVGSVMGSGETRHSSTLLIPRGLATAVHQNKTRLYIYGRAEYFTIFDKINPKITEVTSQVFIDTNHEFPFAFTNRGEQNSAS